MLQGWMRRFARSAVLAATTAAPPLALPSPAGKFLGAQGVYSCVAELLSIRIYTLQCYTLQLAIYTCCAPLLPRYGSPLGRSLWRAAAASSVVRPANVESFHLCSSLSAFDMKIPTTHNLAGLAHLGAWVPQVAACLHLPMNPRGCTSHARGLEVLEACANQKVAMLARCW